MKQWREIRCEAQGRGHIQEGTPCQDKTFDCVKNGIRVIALADGAGSARLSHFGAEAAVQFICKNLSNNFTGYFENNDGAAVKANIVRELQEAIKSEALKRQCTPRDLASTLLFAALDGRHFILGHIGDGVIGYLKNDELKTASLGQSGEFVNSTIFTTSKDAAATMALIKGELGEIRGFILMSDGTEASLFDKAAKKPAEVFRRIIKKVATAKNKKHTEELEKDLQKSLESSVCQMTMDDCSLAILAKKESRDSESSGSAEKPRRKARKGALKRGG